MAKTAPPLHSGQRTLAAIVFTDAVGFSTRMEADEAGTLARAEAEFRLMRDLCTQHEGVVIKSTGDGLLCYFNSAVQAVAFAVAIQKALREQAPALGPGEPLDHRIGIHLGDVVVAESDVHGDGVNVAARLQAEAPPGGICLSQTVYDVVRNKLELQVRFLGERELKNLAQTVPIYEITSGGPAGPGATRPPLRRGQRFGEHRWKIVAAALGGGLLVALVLVLLDLYFQPRPSPAEAPAPTAQANTPDRAPNGGSTLGTSGGRPDVRARVAEALRADNGLPLAVRVLGDWAASRLAAQPDQTIAIGAPLLDAVRLKDDNTFEVRAGDDVRSLPFRDLTTREFSELLTALALNERSSGRRPEMRFIVGIAAYLESNGYDDLSARLHEAFPGLPAQDRRALLPRRPNPGP